MQERFPARIYSETVLGPNFEDAKKYFLDSLLQIHYAHTRMLRKQAIVTPEEERQLLAALDRLDRGQIDAARYDGSCEDLFFFIERLLEEACGREVAGKMHTARSRNDIAITLYRMTARRELLKIARDVAEARSVLLGLAAEHLETVMPAAHAYPARAADHARALSSGGVRIPGPGCPANSGRVRAGEPMPDGRGRHHHLRVPD